MMSIVDLASGAATDLVEHSISWNSQRYLLTSTHLIWFDTWTHTFWRVARSGGAPQSIDAPLPDNGFVDYLSTAGDSLLTGRILNQSYFSPDDPTTLQATPMAGGNPVTVLSLPHWVSTLADGTAVALGGVGPTFALNRIQGGATPTITRIIGFNPLPATTKGLALAGRRLLTIDDSGFNNLISGRPLGLAGPLVSGPRAPLGSPVAPSFCNASCGHALVAGGWTAYLPGPGETNGVSVRDPFGRLQTFVKAPGSGEPILMDLTPSLVRFYDSAHRLIDLRTGQALSSPTMPYGLWGSTIWSARSDVATSGVFEGFDTVTQTTTSRTTPARCAPEEVRVVGRWLYWRCEASTAGVFDLQTNRGMTVPAFVDTALGDGFLVWSEYPSRHLNMIDLTSPTPTQRTLATLPESNNSLPWRGVRWAADAYGGQVVAYVGADQSIHVLPVGVPASPLSLVGSTVPPTVAAGGWRPTWTLSKPASWTLTITDRTGRILQTTSGATEAASIVAGWPGLGPKKTGVSPFAWRLVAVPADGVGATLTLSGQIFSSSGPPAQPPRRI
jgi:hypothetical protein